MVPYEKLADTIHRLRLKLDSVTTPSATLGMAGGLMGLGPLTGAAMSSATGDVLNNHKIAVGASTPQPAALHYPGTSPATISPTQAMPPVQPLDASPRIPSWVTSPMTGMGHPAPAPQPAPQPQPPMQPSAAPVPMPMARPAGADAPTMMQQASNGPQFNPATGSWGYPTSPTSGPELIQKMMSLLGKKTDNA